MAPLHSIAPAEDQPTEFVCLFPPHPFFSTWPPSVATMLTEVAHLSVHHWHSQTRFHANCLGNYCMHNSYRQKDDLPPTSPFIINSSWSPCYHPETSFSPTPTLPVLLVSLPPTSSGCSEARDSTTTAAISSSSSS